MATANVIVTRTGTGFTVDVTACDLDPTLTLKDFVVLHNGTLVSNANYTKTTQTILTYTGTALAANTSVEVRRRTPTAYIRAPRFGSRISSADWTNELDRITRRAEEYELNGVGSGSITGSQAPQNDPFGVTWSSDIIYPPTRKAVYDWGINLVSNSALTTVLSGYVTNGALTSTLVSYAQLGSPAFTGNPTVPTQTTNDNSTRVASTAYVQNNLVSYLTTANAATTYAPLSSPGLTGNPTAPTPVFNDSDTSIATTAFVSSRLRLHVAGITSSVTNTAGAAATVTNWSATNAVDPGGNFNRTTGVWTCPQTGYYRVSFQASVAYVSGTAPYSLFVYFFDVTGNANVVVWEQAVIGGLTPVTGTASQVVRMIAGRTYEMRIFAAGSHQISVSSVTPPLLSVEWVSP